MPKLIYDCIVIGAGAAGCISAIEAAKFGLKVCIVEKNQSIGRKLCITGKGRCNITNACDMDELITNIPENGRFMYSAFNNFSNYDIIDYFNKLGVKTKIERGNRVFPVSDNAKEVKEALLKEMKRLKITIMYGVSVTSLIFDDNGSLAGVNLDTNEMSLWSKNVVIATGGKSYPLTGSTGDGYRLAQSAGHTVTELFPGLVGLRTNEKFVKELNGLTLKNSGVKFYGNGKLIYQDFGELLFTLCGVSGPVVLSSSFALYKFNYENITLEIDLKPALSFETLVDRIKRDFEKYNRRNYSNSLDDLLPQSLIPVIVRLSGISADKVVAEISTAEIEKIAKILKQFTLHVCGYTSFDEAIVTIGGVNSKEVNPKTMESKICPGLYIVGEVLNVTAYTGGFNLTVAFSGGYVAGHDIGEKFGG